MILPSEVMANGHAGRRMAHIEQVETVPESITGLVVDSVARFRDSLNSPVKPHDFDR